jgi:hypothetical protein
LGVFRQQVSDYHARHDPQLLGFPIWVTAHAGRWDAEHKARLRIRAKSARTPIEAENAGDLE